MLRDKIEHIFSAEYLFDHEIFRKMASPKGGPEHDSPPLVPLSTIARFSSIQEALQMGELTNEGIDKIVSALQGSPIVSAVHDERAGWCVRRTRWLRDDEDPARRMVYARPIHPNASNEEIENFFQKFGVIQKIDRSKAPPDDKCMHFAVLRFATEESAEACVKSNVSYGTLDSPLGQHFVPKLHVMLYSEFKERDAQKAAVREQDELRKNMERAQEVITGAPFRYRKALGRGRTLKITGVPPGVS